MDDTATEIDDHVIDESGRKLLVFSDNRQEAAFMLGILKSVINRRCGERLFLNCLIEAGEVGLSVDDLISKSKQMAEKEGLYTLDLVERNNELEVNIMSNEQRSKWQRIISCKNLCRQTLEQGWRGLDTQIMPEKIQFQDGVSRYGVEGGENIWNVYRFVLTRCVRKAQ